VRKLTFEGAVLMVFVLIILISTSDITGKYIDITGRSIDRLLKRNAEPRVVTEVAPSYSFPSMLVDAKIFSITAADATVYNNAAVSAYRAGKPAQAVQLQQKALALVPAVEFYYNLGRMYEDDGDYKNAVNNYLVVANAERNLVKVDRIDPVRVKEKISRLTAKIKSTKSSEGVLFTVPLKDAREILTISENELQLKAGDFTVDVAGRNTIKDIKAKYNSEKYDPYNLITELLWTVYKDGRKVFTQKGEALSYQTSEAGKYEIGLNIKYDGYKEKVSSKTVEIKGRSATVADKSPAVDTVSPGSTPSKTGMRTYEYALYEQLFESDYSLSSAFRDALNVTWGKDENISLSFNKKLMMDKASSLVVRNNSDIQGGIWTNLDSFIKKEDVRGKNIKIRFHARKVTENGNLNMLVRIMAEDQIEIYQEIYKLNFKWQENTYDLYLPVRATGLTISIKTSPDQEFNIDSFLILD
jgi:tetratricopeptide (TPR) repeat protein